MDPQAHPQILPIAFLLGTWRGEGRGEYPTIESFGYTEEVRFWHVGKPFVAYTQRTWAEDDGRPLHAEMGYWRPQPDGSIEIVMAHPTGIGEIEVGTVEGNTIRVACDEPALAPTAKDVTRIERTFTVEGDLLRYELRMAAVGLPFQHHLSAELRRVDG